MHLNIRILDASCIKNLKQIPYMNSQQRVQFVFLDLDLLMKIQATTCITPRALDNLVTLKRKRQLCIKFRDYI